HGLADARAPEEANLSAFQEGLNQIDDLDAGLEHLERGGLIFERRRRTMNRIARLAGERTELVNRLAEHVHHATECWTAHRNLDWHALIDGFHAADQAFCRLHGDGADAPFTQVLLYFSGYVDRLGRLEAVAGNLDGVVNRGKMTALELQVEHRPDDL